ncbi:hypothetical protein GCM10011349_16170 [Novosphingobium indicum]|uniref:Uncharacterized protein n=1 Tax=Novosphingobium indicum TaxID=462949 RepID=A0ABQ2JLK5_9SPHN|nr:hypothetical protein GCM10011349_16170 [Novosphingobium indicum]
MAGSYPKVALQAGQTRASKWIGDWQFGQAKARIAFLIKGVVGANARHALSVPPPCPQRTYSVTLISIISGEPKASSCVALETATERDGRKGHRGGKSCDC